MESPRSVGQTLSNFIYINSWMGGKAAFRFWSRFHHNCGCHVNRKLPLTYNGKNDASTLTPSVLIRKFLIDYNGKMLYPCYYVHY